MTRIDAEGYLAFQQFLEVSTGIVLGPGNEELLAARLTRLLLEEGVPTLRELVRLLESRAVPRLRTAVIDAMTTPETSWFRDPAQFRILTEGVLAGATGSRLRLWSAACSTGQEPYSLSIAVQEFLQQHVHTLPGGVEIVATDIAQSALDAARRGIYCGPNAGRGLSAERRQRCFTQQGDCFSVRQELRQRVVFRQFNLTGSIQVLGQFDAIFCRNVLNYFAPERRHDVLDRLVGALRPGGYLFLGAADPADGAGAGLETHAAHGGVAYRRP